MKESRSSRQKRCRGEVRSGTTTTVGGGSQHRQSAVVVCTVSQHRCLAQVFSIEGQH